MDGWIGVGARMVGSSIREREEGDQGVNMGRDG